MNKKILMLPLLLLLTGCTVNYNLEINEDSLTETISGTVSKEEYELKKEYTSPPIAYSLINDPQKAIYDNDSELYIKNIRENNDNFEYTFSYIYNNNFDKSSVINTCFENHEIYETDELYHINLSGQFYCLYSKNININVISNMKVINSNAKKVNGNTYSWTINKPNNVNIQMDISKKEVFKENNKKSNSFRIVSFIILIILCTIAYFLYKNKNSDI